MRTKEVKLSEEKLKHIINNVSTFIFVIDIDGNLLHYNNVNDIFYDKQLITLWESSYKIINFLRDIDLQNLIFNKMDSKDYYSIEINKEIKIKNDNNEDIWLKILLKPIDTQVFGKQL